MVLGAPRSSSYPGSPLHRVATQAIAPDAPTHRVPTHLQTSAAIAAPPQPGEEACRLTIHRDVCKLSPLFHLAAPPRPIPAPAAAQAAPAARIRLLGARPAPPIPASSTAATHAARVQHPRAHPSSTRVGATATTATADCGGLFVQRAKLTDSADGGRACRNGNGQRTNIS